jgi:hypothetical protein
VHCRGLPVRFADPLLRSPLLIHANQPTAGGNAYLHLGPDRWEVPCRPFSIADREALGGAEVRSTGRSLGAAASDLDARAVILL